MNLSDFWPEARTAILVTEPPHASAGETVGTGRDARMVFAGLPACRVVRADLVDAADHSHVLVSFGDGQYVREGDSVEIPLNPGLGLHG